jgi:predicted TIM-barrel fold metal-dependent hydrolase
LESRCTAGETLHYREIAIFELNDRKRKRFSRYRGSLVQTHEGWEFRISRGLHDPRTQFRRHAQGRRSGTPRAGAVASLLFGGALTRYPNIRFILPHAGGTIPYLAARISAIGASPYAGKARRAAEETQRMLAALYYDTALSANQTQFDALHALVPMSNILFGSDYPWNPGASVVGMSAAFRQFHMSDQDRTLILQGNSAKLFPGLHGRCFGHQIRSR